MAGENLQERKRLGATYAAALYDLASGQGALDAVREELLAWRGFFRQDPELIDVLDSVLISEPDRAKLLDDLTRDFHPLVRDFLGVLNRRNRLGTLPQIIDAFEDEDNRRRNRVEVKLTTAAPIDDHLRDQIRETLRQYLKSEPVIEHELRPEILGGFIARANDVLIDGSVKTRLETLKKSLLTRGEDEIQSRRDFISNQT